jgi:aspartate racemase
VVHAIGAQGETHGVEHSIEQMAEIYLPEVLAVCPASGPIFVGGYSFGVLVAYEIAHRLRQAGREVPLIVSFDGFAPGFPQRMPLVDRLVDHARTFVHADGAGKKHYLEARLRSLSARLRGEHDRFEANDVIASVAQADAQLGRRLKEVSNSLWRARNAYRPTYRVRADLLLVRSDVPERWVGSRMDDPLYGWGAWMEGALEQVTIAATHLTLFDPANRLLMAQAVLNAMNARLPQARV